MERKARWQHVTPVGGCVAWRISHKIRCCQITQTQSLCTFLKTVEEPLLTLYTFTNPKYNHLPPPWSVHTKTMGVTFTTQGHHCFVCFIYVHVNFCTRWRWVVSFMPQLLIPGERRTVPVDYVAGLPTGRVFMLWTRDKSLDPARTRTKIPWLFSP